MSGQSKTIWFEFSIFCTKILELFSRADAEIVHPCFQSKDDTAKTYYAIRLPYQLVKETDDVRPMMLELAAKRLGISVPGEMGW
ncbi:MAG: hypothetical protein DYG98_22505 [Haliscomenobacteraceae bacterium CHB4]|nr:hypothetical protein [Haliscomenobacteraceae bacterium CHB4]